MLTEIISQMESRGFVKVLENPDLIINLGVSVVSKEQTRKPIFETLHFIWGNGTINGSQKKLS